MRGWIKTVRNLTWLTQLGLSLIAPPLLCVGGAWWLQQRFSLGGWILVLGLVLGIGGMVSAAVGFYHHVQRQAKRDGKQRPDAFNSHR